MHPYLALARPFVTLPMSWRWTVMTKVAAGITMSVDGYITGPDDGPEKGLGEGGERLHYWVFGGPWTYDKEPEGGPSTASPALSTSSTTGCGSRSTRRSSTTG
jgi:hypothetical protein